MKIVSTITALVLFSFASLASSVSVVPTKDGVFSIQYKNTEKNNVRVSILNNQQEVIFSENFYNVSSFKRPYNFSQLAEGDYTIVIEDKNGKQVEKITYQLNKVVSYVHVAAVPNKENRYWVSVANNGFEVLAVRIYGQDGTQLHEQTLEVTGTLSTVFDLSKIKNNKAVTFEVVDGNGHTHKATF